MSNITVITLNKFGKRARGCCVHIFLLYIYILTRGENPFGSPMDIPANTDKCYEIYLHARCVKAFIKGTIGKFVEEINSH